MSKRSFFAVPLALAMIGAGVPLPGLTGEASTAVGWQTGPAAEPPGGASGERILSAKADVALWRARPWRAAIAPAAPDNRIVLDGTGIASRWAPGCRPELRNDFMDNRSWNGRRVAPQDCARVRTSAPVFAWPQPGDRDASARYRLQVHSVPGGAIVLDAETDVPRMAMRELLPAGEYRWQVSYRTRRGSEVTSEARRFAVDAESQPVVFPSGEVLASHVAAKPHPRVLPAGTSFEAIAAAASGSPLHRAHLDTVIRTADRALRTELPTPDKTELTGSALRRAITHERNLIEACALAHRFTGRDDYRQHGMVRLMSLAQWSPTGVTSDAAYDYANGQMYLTLAMGVDLFDGYLNKAQRELIAGRLRDRFEQGLRTQRRLSFSPFDSHATNLVWTMTQALLHVAGMPELPESQTWLQEVWETLETTADTWGGVDGGSGHGVAYAWYRITVIAQTLAAIRVIADVDFAKHPWVQRAGDFLIAMTAPNAKHMSAVGDDTENKRLFEIYAPIDFRLYASLTDQSAHQWYQGVNRSNGQRYPGMWQLMLTALGLAPAAGTPPARDSWLFADVGVAALHSRTADDDRSSLFFRSSEFGAAVHSQADQNAFTFVSRGRDLLISGGYYPRYMSPHHASVTRATRYKNALTFDGGIGQAEASPAAAGKPVLSRDARGQIVNFHDQGEWAIATGDATLAYRHYDAATRSWAPLLDNAVRTVAYNRRHGVAVIYDWATSSTPRRWELNFNALEPFDANGRSARVSNGDAAGCIDVHGPTGAFHASSGFDVPPENGAPAHHQARYVAAAKSKEWVTVTIIREHCRDINVPVNISETAVTVAVDGGPTLAIDRRATALLSH